MICSLLNFWKSATAICIDLTGNVVLNRTLSFEEVVAGCRGFLENEDEFVRHSDPAIWLDALERLLKFFLKSKYWEINFFFRDCRELDQFDFSKVTRIGGSAQQHGSIYLNESFLRLKGSWDSGLSLSEQIKPLLSRPTCPIWMVHFPLDFFQDVYRTAQQVMNAKKYQRLSTWKNFLGAAQLRGTKKSSP